MLQMPCNARHIIVKERKYRETLLDSDSEWNEYLLGKCPKLQCEAKQLVRWERFRGLSCKMEHFNHFNILYGFFLLFFRCIFSLSLFLHIYWIRIIWHNSQGWFCTACRVFTATEFNWICKLGQRRRNGRRGKGLAKWNSLSRLYGILFIIEHQKLFLTGFISSWK